MKRIAKKHPLAIRWFHWINVPLLAIDVMLFAVLFKLLRLRYLDARRERRFAGGG